VGKPEGRKPLGRPRRRWVDNIRTDSQKVGCGYMDWIGLVQDRDIWRTLVSAVMNLRVLWNAWNFLTSCKPVRFSRRTLHRGVSKYYWKYLLVTFPDQSRSPFCPTTQSSLLYNYLSFVIFLPYLIAYWSVRWEDNIKMVLQEVR